MLHIYMVQHGDSSLVIEAPFSDPERGAIMKRAFSVIPAEAPQCVACGKRDIDQLRHYYNHLSVGSAENQIIYIAYGCQHNKECLAVASAEVGKSIDIYRSVLKEDGVKVQGGCTVCSATDKKTMSCKHCRLVRYCSIECQKKHWPTHKPYCMLSPKEKETMKE
jgi:hypothetical protein